MEASSLKVKKQIQKGKLKKTLKHVICRPDSNFWPLISETESKALTEELNNLKVDIPDYKKPQWSEISHIPKESRPKPPPIPKVDGLIFGITECKKLIETKECTGILIDAEVNPKTIVQPLIDLCLDKAVPVLCLKELKIMTDKNFGISTSVLGVKQSLLPKLEKKFLEISMNHKPPNNIAETYTPIDVVPGADNNVEMKTSNSDTNESEEEVWEKIPCPYVYRIGKLYRSFSPSIYTKVKAKCDFFKVAGSTRKENAPSNSKPFMKMNVKKITSNSNRRKVSKTNSKD